MENSDETAGSAPQKLSTVLKRFRDTRDKIENAEKRFNSGNAAAKTRRRRRKEPTAVKAQPLGPVPQPERVKDFKPGSNQLEWPVTPIVVDASARTPFDRMGLSPEMVERLHELDFKEAFAVQAAVIPDLLNHQRTRELCPDPLPDILVQSFTGSGKTLAYCIPIVEALRSRWTPQIRCLILLPTRPLMLQVQQILEGLSRGTGLRVLTLRADRALNREKDLLWEISPDILIATPGRLVDHVKLAPDLLKALRFIVIDEADRLVSQSFQDWTTVLRDACLSGSKPSANGQAPPQRLVFSATLTRDPGKLSDLRIATAPYPPRLYVVGGSDGSKKEFNLPSGLHERLIRISSSNEKPLLLVQQLIDCKGPGKTLVFVHSNEATSRLARLMRHIGNFVYDTDIGEVGVCNGEMSVQERNRALAKFTKGETSILVCTDLISRGIDVPDVSLIVNYDLPLGAREYVHRVGRTARAGALGRAWTIGCSTAERKHFWTIQSEIDRAARFEVKEVTSRGDPKKYQQALKQLESDIFAIN